MTGPFRRARSWVWSDEPAASRPAAAARTAARVAGALVQDFLAGELSLRAMALVYSTMLAIVPLLAFSFSVLQGLGFHREFEPLLMRFLEPLGGRADELADNVMRFVDNVSGTGLATVSLLMLIVTSLLMAQKVETSFNFVWHVGEPRRLARRISDYISVLLVGPVLMSVTMALLAAVSSAGAIERLRGIGPLGDWIAAAGTLTPYVLVVVAFGLLYVFVPNTRVRARPAMIGALFSGLLWVGGGEAFTRLVVNASRYEAIYSGFAIVIMTMLWLYLSWLILLLGAQVAFYLQNPGYLRFGQRAAELSGSGRERLAFAVMLEVGRDFAEQGRGWQVEGLAARLGVPPEQLERVVAALKHERLLTETAAQRLMPAVDPHVLSLHRIASAVRGGGVGSTRPAVDAVAERMDQALQSALDGETLADLIERDAAMREHDAGTDPAAGAAAGGAPPPGAARVTGRRR